MILFKDDVLKKIIDITTIIEKIKSGGDIVASHSGDPSNATTESNFFKTMVVRFFSRMGQFAPPAKSGESPNARLKFLRAGVRVESAAAVFWGLKIFLAVVFPTIFIILRFLFFKLIGQYHQG